MHQRTFFWTVAAAIVLTLATPSLRGQAGQSECPRGTRQAQNGCVAVQIPDNAELDVFGHDWTCKRGYRNAGGGCVAVQIPENAELDVFGHDWTCKRGYRNAGGGCIPVQIPENAELDVFGHDWACSRGFKLAANKCVAMSADELRESRVTPSATRTTAACYESSIMSPTPFMGNSSEIFRLADGSMWEVKYEYEYLYEYYPEVVVCPGRGVLLVAGKTLNVQQITSSPRLPSQAQPQPTSQLIESRIDGEFSGWEGDTIFKLENGQVWQQSSYAYKYKYAYSPKVLIYRTGSVYKMRVDGVDGEIAVTRLK